MSDARETFTEHSVCLRARWLDTPYGQGRYRAWRDYRASIGRPLPLWTRFVVATLLYRS